MYFICAFASLSLAQKCPSGYKFIIFSDHEKNWQFNIKQDKVVTVCLRKEESEWNKEQRPWPSADMHTHQKCKSTLKSEHIAVYAFRHTLLTQMSHVTMYWKYIENTSTRHCIKLGYSDP